MASLISNNDESASRAEMKQLADWCRDESLSLKVNKLKKIIVESGGARVIASLHISGKTQRVSMSLRISGGHIT